MTKRQAFVETPIGDAYGRVNDGSASAEDRNLVIAALMELHEWRQTASRVIHRHAQGAIPHEETVESLRRYGDRVVTRQAHYDEIERHLAEIRIIALELLRDALNRLDTMHLMAPTKPLRYAVHDIIEKLAGAIRDQLHRSIREHSVLMLFRSFQPNSRFCEFIEHP